MFIIFQRYICVPPHLAYGEHGQGDKIPGNSTLFFEIEIVKTRFTDDVGGGKGFTDDVDGGKRFGPGQI